MVLEVRRRSLERTSLLLSEVVAVSHEVAATSSRLAKRDLVADALRAAGPGQARAVAAYLSGVTPQGRVGVGWRTLASLPEPAAEASLTVTDVDAALSALAGEGGRSAKASIVAGLFGRATSAEQDWLRALLLGEVRQGALDGVLIPAVAAAAEVPEAVVRRAAMLAGRTYDVVAPAMAGGEAALSEITLETGRVVRPMLAGSAPDVASAMAAHDGPVAVEAKLDGIRVQVHKSGDDVRVFTRGLDDITARLPEVVELARAMPVQSAVLDGEAIALRPDGRPRPFQETGARTASSRSVEALRAATPLTTYLFDLMARDDEVLLDRPFAERAEALREVVPPDSLVPGVLTADPAAAQAFFDELVAGGHEGVVVKDLASPYAAGARGRGWTKVKPRHTFDLVVLAVEWGSGRRRGKLSNIHLGARGEDGELVMLGKTFKGMTDEMLAWQTQRFLELETHRDDWTVHLRPEQVVEVAVDGVQTSRRYPAGIALRFARVLRYRDDKNAADADTVDSVRALLG